MMEVIAAACLAVSAAGPATALDDTTTIGFHPWMDLVRGPGQPVSLLCTPGGAGRPFAQAMAFGGVPVDATLEVILWSDEPGWGNPVADFPGEDIWLQSTGDGLAPCLGGAGAMADADTDADGRTTWALPLRAGGRVDPSVGDRLLIVVNGDPVQGLPDLQIRINSPDLNGDGRVNLSDVGTFAGDLFGAYAYRSDFLWDGVINVSDAGFMAAALGDQCP